MAKPIANLRLFAAAYPPVELAQQLVDRLSDLPLPRHRPTPPDKIHLTLLFIGDMPETEMESTCESIERSTAGIEPFDLTIVKLITLPERGPARLVAAETSSPASLLEVQRRLATRLALKPSNRDYRPHMTLTRFASPASGTRIDLAIESPPLFTVDRIQLMRSTLRPQGAIHHVVREFQLTG